MKQQIVLTQEQAYALIDQLHEAAGLLSDVQECFELDDSANGYLNRSKKSMFEVIRQIDPRA